MPTPLLIISDNVASTTGLARVSRELTFRIHKHMGDTFRVGTLGFNGGGKLDNAPFPQWNMPAEQHTLANDLPFYWRGFAGGQRGVVMCIANPGWVNWLANPELLPDGMLKEFLRSNPFSKWIYAPVDGHTPSGKLPSDAGKVLDGFDRVLAYTKYGADVIEKTIGRPVEHLPHGLDTSVFRPRDRSAARRTFFALATGQPENPIKDSVTLLGVIATNTERKSWPLAFETCSELIKRGVDVGLWVHSSLNGFWDIPTLAAEYGMRDRTIVSHRAFTDDEMAWLYSACDCTLGIGSGGGWELPLAESLACGVPALHNSYAGGAEFVPAPMQVNPLSLKVNDFSCILRPIANAKDWADRVQQWTAPRDEKIAAPDYIKWNECWPCWSDWLLKGIENG